MQLTGSENPKTFALLNDKCYRPCQLSVVSLFFIHLPGRTEKEAKEVTPKSSVVDKFLSTQNVLPNVTTSNHNVGNR